MNIAYLIIHKKGKFELEIHKWNCMTTVQRTWFRFKPFFWKSRQELQETSNLNVEDAEMHHANMVRNLVAGLQEFLQQEQVLTENTTVIEAPVDHMDKAVQNTQQQLATQPQQI